MTRRFVHNRYDVKVYTKNLLISTMVVLALYIRFFSTFEVLTIWDYVLLISITAIGVVVFWMFSYRCRRNLFSIITIPVFCVLSYDIFTLWEYEEQVQAIVLWGTSVSIIVASVFAFIKCKPIRRKVLKRKMWVEIALNTCRILVSFVFLAGVAVGKQHINEMYTFFYEEIPYLLSETKLDVWDYENSLGPNIDIVAQLDADHWEDNSLESKTQVLKTCIQILTRYYGLDCAPALKIAYIDEKTKGSYDKQEDCITLSYQYLVETKDGLSILHVISHEIYHKYEYAMVELLNDIRNSDTMEKFANLLLLSDAATYEKEMKNYFNEVDDIVSYTLYASQQMECDAEKNADIVVETFTKRIEEYWEQKRLFGDAGG